MTPQPQQFRKHRLGSTHERQVVMRRKVKRAEKRRAARSGEVRTHQATPEERERYGMGG